MSHGYVAYIDEAGDDGVGRFREPGLSGQSHWLVLGACIVSAENAVRMPAWRDEIASAFPKKKSRDIHFRDLDHPQRVFAAQTVSQKPLGAMVVLSYKPSISNYPAFFVKCKSEKNLLYKFILRQLLEKLSDAISRAYLRKPSGDGRVKIVFSRRKGMDYPDFQDYLRYLKNLQQTRGAKHPIKWEHIDIEAVSAEDHSRIAGLQIADVIASSFFKAVESDAYKLYETRYARTLTPIIVANHAGVRLGYGVKTIPELAKIPLETEPASFMESWKAP